MRIAGRIVVMAAVGAMWIGALGGSALASTSAFTSWQVAGNGSQCATPPACGDGGSATGATLNYPEAVAVGPGGSTYIADWGDNEIRRVSAGGTISAVAGTGTPCFSAPSCGDGGAALASHLSYPEGVAVDPRDGTVYIADTGDNQVRKVSTAGVITLVAGTGASCSTPPSCGDGGAATSARLSSPQGVAVGRKGNVYIADSGDNEVRMISTHGTITRLAGDGKFCAKAGACGDGAAATAAQLYFPHAVALGAKGDLFIADGGDNKVRQVASDGTISTVAGTGTMCAAPPGCGDGGSAKQAELAFPDGVAVDAAGNLYIADQGDSEVRRVSTDGTITRIAGTGAKCAKPPVCGDGGAATGATLDYPDGVAVDAQGNVLVADTLDHEVRWLSAPQFAPGHLQTAAGKVAVLAFRPDIARNRVVVYYAVGASAQVSLAVSGAGRSRAVVARGGAHSGFGTLSWNRRFGKSAAPHGKYTLSVTATLAGRTASSGLTIRL